jgi:hypothetical protein
VAGASWWIVAGASWWIVAGASWWIVAGASWWIVAGASWWIQCYMKSKLAIRVNMIIFTHVSRIATNLILMSAYVHDYKNLLRAWGKGD